MVIFVGECICLLSHLPCVLLQLRIYKTPDLETPIYQILKRTANYEVVLYANLICALLRIIYYTYGELVRIMCI